MRNSSAMSNAKWIIGCRLIQSMAQFVIGTLSARYLGPSNYGLIGFAASVVGFAVPIMQLGLRATLVQEYLSNPEREGEVLGTSLVLSIVSGAACMIGIFCFVSAFNPGEGETILVCVLYSLSLIFQAAELTQYWFQAKLLSKYPSVVMLGAYGVVSAYKIFLLATQKSVYWFALSHAVEYGVIGLGLLAVYRKLSNQKLWFSWKLGKKLFARSKYYILSGLMVTVFQNTDQVMLKLMINETENGFYSTAVTCAGLATFVYNAIIDSARPGILCAKHRSETVFEASISKLYTVILYLALAQSLCVAVLAGPIVWILYGDAYIQAVPILRILVLYLAFSYIGTVRNIWILAEEKQSLLWRINLSGALVNVILNSILIPVWGARGAAAASVMTQIFTNFILGFLMKPIRPCNRLLLRGMRFSSLKCVVFDLRCSR